MTNIEIRKAIKEEFDSRPDKQISLGIYLHSVGPKWVTIMDCHVKTTFEKIPIRAFDGIGELIDNGDFEYCITFGELLDEYYGSLR